MKKMDLFGERLPAVEMTFIRRNLLIRLVKFLEDSPYIGADTLTFKGGLFLGEYTGRPRYTQDVDASIITADAYLRVREVLKEFGEMLISEDIIHEYDVKEDVIPGRSGGAKYIDAKGRVLLSIDVSLHGDVLLDTMIVDTTIAGTLRLTTIEQVVCDKLSVLFTRSCFRRAKDLYDMWLILSNCAPDVQKVAELLNARNAFPLPLERAPFRDDCIKEMEHAYDRFILKDPISEEPLSKPPYSEVVTKVGAFMTKFMRDDT